MTEPRVRQDPVRQTPNPRSSVFTIVLRIGEMVGVALVSWSAISILVALGFGVMIRVGRRSWVHPHDSDGRVARVAPGRGITTTTNTYLPIATRRNRA